MGIIFSLVVVAALIGIASAGVNIVNLQFLFGVIIPYAALLIFLAGMVLKVLKWGRSPVPYCIPTTCGQQKSLPWIKYSKLDNPSGSAGVVGRMLLEILLFRSLFRNLKSEMRDGPRVVYGWEKWLWLGGLVFHWCFLIIIIRHLRFFTQPVPALVNMVDSLDGFLQIGTPHFLITGVLLLAAVTYLLLRRLLIPQVKYISLSADYFPLFLIMAIASTGILMRYFIRVDIIKVKELTISLATLSPKVPDGIGTIFYIHIFLISMFFAYFPFSKLVHLGGIFLSPTRNLPNNSRVKRHVNPWSYDVKVHTYEEYEDEFRDKMKTVNLPLEKE
ncbi:nitrate reductase gamma subunit [bacterium BMS3Abin07]|nr:nitrate reductase gamma subunit [bacterium BMS3Abin07]HDL20326.1 menaquinol oxidoreductase [Nitrospirota bacterium]HDO22685.1 menaquinol oxidoreductase [Nitrospirota bacterium]HDZ89031.1 menaquinol oxidoreductase [Nitrospirota bacterium]